MSIDNSLRHEGHAPRRNGICGIAALAFAVSASFGPAAAEGDARMGAIAYRGCVACHSLEPGLHLTGPSLAGLWGKRAASLKDFPRYSKALKTQDFLWDEVTLNAWLADPKAFVAGTSMTFRGIAEEKARADLIAFLRLAMAEGGAASLVARGLITDRTARGQAPESLERATREDEVATMRHCRNSFFVVTADGKEHAFWEMNLRLKVDSGPTGPKGGKPVLTAGGMMGDRASVVFSAPSQISTFIRQGC
jgi:cytochrome c